MRLSKPTRSDLDPRPYLDAGPTRVVANLPYNIATRLLVAWLSAEPWPPWYDDLVLMFQREVAERLIARSGLDSYGRLSVLVGWRCTTRLLFDIAPSAFVPAPKVTSSLVRLMPRPRPLAADSRDLERVTEAAFGQRRKMLRQSLRSLVAGPVATGLRPLGIDPTARAETYRSRASLRWHARSRDAHKYASPVRTARVCRIAIYNSLCSERTNSVRPSCRSRLSRSAARMARTSAKVVLEVAVDDDVVVFRPVAHFVAGLGHAAVDHGVADPGRALFSRRSSAGDRWWQHKNADEIAARALAYLLRTLPIEIEQHVAAGAERLVDRGARRAVEIAEHVGPFQ